MPACGKVMGTASVQLTEIHSAVLSGAAALILAASLLMSKLRSRWPLWIRVLAQLTLFVALTAMVHHSLGSPLQPDYGGATGAGLIGRQLIAVSWWVVGAHLASGIARLFIVLESRPRETQIVSDLVAGAISVATTLAVINFAFEVPIRNLLATSGVIAIVLGLALQSTLSDVFSGIAVGIEHPYKVGDLLWVEGGIEGRVLQVNWRSTHIATADHNIAVVPNSVIAKARLVNRSAPSSARGATITVALDADTPPEQCEAVLTAAALSCSIMQDKPAPTVTCTELKGEGSTWDISFSIDGPEKLAGARTELLTQIHRHLRHAGIAFAVPGGHPVKLPLPDVARLLQDSAVFGTLPAELRAALVPCFHPTSFAAGTVLGRAGERSPHLLIIAAGTVEITTDDASGPQRAYRMSPGETLGVVGLVTETANAATATALTPVRAFALSKAALDAVTAEQPELAAALRHLAADLVSAMKRRHTTAEMPTDTHPTLFLSRLRTFLQVLDS
jgi:small-conductance mechanosensitive channel/CRP-like cAMP-binding protein